jgi:hypothetical protein
MTTALRNELHILVYCIPPNPDQQLSYYILHNGLSMEPKNMSNMVHKPLAPLQLSLSNLLLLISLSIQVYSTTERKPLKLKPAS